MRKSQSVMTPDFDLFGKEIVKDPLLRDKFIEPPFSVLDTKSGNWQRRKKLWKAIGMRSEVGRDVELFSMGTKKYANKEEYHDEKSRKFNTSIFDPALCEVLYHWFCPEGGMILDPFAGGSVRGIVAHKLGYKYIGIDIREEQIVSNREQGNDILHDDNQPLWYLGDSDEVLNASCIGGYEEFDFVFSCPPYADLEVYSDLKGDISNMAYEAFRRAYSRIIRKSCDKLRQGGFACFVVGEIRDKDGYYIGFVPDTIDAFESAGMRYYNEAILLNPVASASMRAGGNMKTNKLVKIHQNVLVFKKP